jgi:hypothetical protein
MTDRNFARPLSDIVRITRAQPITIAAEYDNDARLIMVGGRLSGVLVRLDEALHGEGHGRWFLEAGFGDLADAAGASFETLEEAIEEIRRLVEPRRAGEASRSECCRSAAAALFPDPD